MIYQSFTQEEILERRRENQKRYYAKTHRSGEEQTSKWQLMFIGECTFKKICKIHKIKYEKI